MLVVDANVYAPLIVALHKRFLEVAQRYSFAILDLTIYETCNAFWKEHVKLRRISFEEAVKACLAAKMLTKWLKVYRFEDLDFEMIARIALENNITVYDASYIALAITLKTQIASEDKDIVSVAPKYKVSVVRLYELLM